MSATDKSKSQALLPVRLLMLYLVSYCLIPTISFFLDYGDFEGEIEGWNTDLEFSLILCVPFFGLIILAIRYFSRMPIFSGIIILLGMFHIGDTLAWYFSDEGFNDKLEPVNLQFSGCLLVALFWAIPFLIIYCVWRFWPRRQTETPLFSSPPLS